MSSRLSVQLPKYRLTYFDIRGKGELPRLLFAAAGKKFEDIRIEFREWPGTLKEWTPYGHLPVLELDGTKHAYGSAISNYLAREFKLYAKTNSDALKIDQVVCLAQDFYPSYSNMHFGEESKREEFARKYKEEDIPKFLGYFEKLLEESRSEYFVGNGLTMADLAAYDVIGNAMRETPDVLEKYPNIEANRRKVESNPMIASYLRERKDTII